MQHLSAEGSRIVADVARRYDVSTDAVLTLLAALRRGGGTQAQFSHPDLGGMGQWSRGGMVMVGDMFNHALKDRVDRLCTELSGLDADASMVDRTPTSQSQSQSQSQSSGGRGASLFVPASEGGRWPAALGDPASAGSQNDLHYAVFPRTRRLAIERGGRITIYDTGDHQITGFSQQQSGDQSITFTSQHGVVRVADLPVVDGAEGEPVAKPAPAKAAVDQNAPQAAAAVAAARHPDTSDDIFGRIERLAELRSKDILTAAEFEAKKAELLGRL